MHCHAAKKSNVDKKKTAVFCLKREISETVEGPRSDRVVTHSYCVESLSTFASIETSISSHFSVVIVTDIDSFNR